jgi:hypothetical protein
MTLSGGHRFNNSSVGHGAFYGGPEILGLRSEGGLKSTPSVSPWYLKTLRSVPIIPGPGSQVWPRSLLLGSLSLSLSHSHSARSDQRTTCKSLPWHLWFPLTLLPPPPRLSGASRWDILHLLPGVLHPATPIQFYFVEFWHKF